ncbi:MAG: hypothetical protein BAJALOKI1v1_200009 [Promethearchaeota archaeon]|nr:MAG: hypothetical protein BAJALOKI1v1_200009 [Candidatus Lokiarchaeota archaeon]
MSYLSPNYKFPYPKFYKCSLRTFPLLGGDESDILREEYTLSSKSSSARFHAKGPHRVVRIHAP